MFRKISGVLFALSILFSCALSILPNFSGIAFAQNCDPTAGGIDLGTCYKLNDTRNVSDVYNKPAVLINQIITYTFVAAGLIFFFLLIYCGYLYISEDSKAVEKAKTLLETAGMGFVLMFSAYWVIQIIQVVTGTKLLF